MISVCMTTYNGEKYLAQQLDSILFQLNDDDELLISDDGSTDATLKIIKEYQLKDQRIRLFNGPQKGVIRNVAFVLEQTKGNYIFLSDQDDIWLPNRVNKMKQVFLNNPSIQLVLSDLEVINQEEEVLYSSYFQLRRVRLGRWHNIIRSGFIGAGMAITAELKEKALPFPSNLPMHDMWLGIIAGKHVFLLEDVLTQYRRHEENVSEIETTTSAKQKIKWRFSILKALFYREFLKK